MSDETPEKKVGISVKPAAEKVSADDAATPSPEADSASANGNGEAAKPEAVESPAVAPTPAFKAPEKPAHRAQAAPVLKVAATSSAAPAASARPAAVAYDGEAVSMAEVIIDGVVAAVAVAFFVLTLQQFLG